jgi:hypothetical protein
MVCSKPARAVLIVFNFLFLIIGVALIVVGIWSKDPSFSTVWSKLPLNNVISVSQLNSLTWILIITGSFSFILGIIGCVGAKKKNRILLTLYLLLIIILLIFELVGIYFGVSFQGRFKKDLNNVLTETINESVGRVNGTDSSLRSIATATLDQIQSAFHCCGSSSPQDFLSLNASLPFSCFHNGEAITRGCSESIFNAITSNIPIVMGSLVVIMVIELCAIMFSICVCAKHKNKQEIYEQF